MSRQEKSSLDSISEANRERAKFSGHGNALGAAGKSVSSTDSGSSHYLRDPGQSVAVTPGAKGFPNFYIGVEWDNIQTKDAGLIEKVFKKTIKAGVDLDLGCLYELRDGSRGAVQAFGKKFGNFDAAPFIKLSGDERTGDRQGLDEVIQVNGPKWGEIVRLLVYIYIYDGAARWSEVNPRVVVDVPGEEDLIVTLGHRNAKLPLCAVGSLENVRDGIKLTNHTEYFPGHEEMDRAFGFGLDWADGKKN